MGTSRRPTATRAPDQLANAGHAARLSDRRVSNEQLAIAKSTRVRLKRCSFRWPAVVRVGSISVCAIAGPSAMSVADRRFRWLQDTSHGGALVKEDCVGAPYPRPHRNCRAADSMRPQVVGCVGVFLQPLLEGLQLSPLIRRS